MASKEEKQWALSTAINIITKAAEGGYDKQLLSSEMNDLYETLILLHEKSNKDE